MDTQKSTMLVGNIAGAYGVKGWLKVSSYTDPLDNIFKYSPWQLVSPRAGKTPLDVKLVQGKLHGKGLVVQLEGISDRDEAESLKGLEIHVERERVPDPDSGHYYWADLEGLQVQSKTGTVLGRVDRLIDTGSADVMVVCGEKRHLIPFIYGDTVLNVDLEAGCIRVDWDSKARLEHG
jgi:16S rRNA processing protein RimM